MFLRYFSAGVIALFLLAAPAFADGSLTLQLDTPALDKQPEKQARDRTTPTVTTVTTKAAPRKTVGRVALVSSDRASIYAQRNPKSRVYSICTKDCPLAVVTSSGNWYGVMMIDGSTGWVQASKVRLLDYGFVPPQPSRGSYASRHASISRGDAANNPIIQTALQYVGVPYVYGGTSTISGMDCSAFVRMVFGQLGVNLPRTAREQAAVGAPVDHDDLQPGDRLYFAAKHDYVDHCGIYMGNGYFIHASASRGGVSVDNLSKKFYSGSLVAVMRS
jgi:cell wall-associated NlpC family hydrolase